MLVFTSAVIQVGRPPPPHEDDWLDKYVNSLGLADSLCLVGILWMMHRTSTTQAGRLSLLHGDDWQSFHTGRLGFTDSLLLRELCWGIVFMFLLQAPFGLSWLYLIVELVVFHR